MTCFPMVFAIWFVVVSLGKPPIMAITLFLDRDRAKSRDHLRLAWEKLHWKPPIMASSLYFDRPRAKTSDDLRPVGKIPVEIANHGHHAFLGPQSCQSQQQKRNLLGKIPAEIANHGHHALFNPPRAYERRQGLH